MKLGGFFALSITSQAFLMIKLVMGMLIFAV